MALAQRTILLLRKAVLTAHCVLARHYYRVFVLNFAKEAFLLSIFECSSVIAVQLTLVYQIRTQLELALIL